MWDCCRRPSSVLACLTGLQPARTCSCVCVLGFFHLGWGLLRVSCLALTGSHLSEAVRPADVCVSERCLHRSSLLLPEETSALPSGMQLKRGSLQSDWHSFSLSLSLSDFLSISLSLYLPTRYLLGQLIKTLDHAVKCLECIVKQVLFVMLLLFFCPQLLLWIINMITPWCSTDYVSPSFVWDAWIIMMMITLLQKKYVAVAWFIDGIKL